MRAASSADCHRLRVRSLTNSSVNSSDAYPSGISDLHQIADLRFGKSANTACVRIRLRTLKAREVFWRTRPRIVNRCSRKRHLSVLWIRIYNELYAALDSRGAECLNRDQESAFAVNSGHDAHGLTHTTSIPRPMRNYCHDLALRRRRCYTR